MNINIKRMVSYLLCFILMVSSAAMAFALGVDSFSDDFQSGTLSKWRVAASKNNVGVVNDPLSSSNKAVRFNLQKNGATSARLIKDKVAPYGSTVRYGWRFMVDPSHSNNAAYEKLTMFPAYSGADAPTVGVYYQSGSIKVYIYDSVTKKHIFSKSVSLTKGKWVKLDLEIKWSNDGYVKAWIDGNDITDGGITGPTTPNTGGNFLELGVYRPSGSTGTSRVFYDDVTIKEVVASTTDTTTDTNIGTTTDSSTGTSTGTTTDTSDGATADNSTTTSTDNTTGSTDTTTSNVTGTKTEQAYATPNLPSTIASMRLYSDSSPFNKKIASDVKVDENSALMVGSLKEAFNTRGLQVTRNSYSVSVFYADANTPRYNVKRTASWSGGTTLYDVPIPDYAVPDAGEGHMTIIDLSNGYEYDFWLAQKTNGVWTAGWANKTSYTGDGVYPDGLAARGSGMALAAGLIWPEELKNGYIDHALVFSYPFTKAKEYVYPASKTDGTSTRADAIPEGARVQLDPTLNLDALGLTSYEKTIARAMQEYGMILCDTNGGPIELEAVNPVSAEGNAYEGLLPDDTYVFLRKIPVDRFRIIDIP